MIDEKLVERFLKRSKMYSVSNGPNFLSLELCLDLRSARHTKRLELLVHPSHPLDDLGHVGGRWADRTNILARRIAATFFVFLARFAGARVVPANFRHTIQFCTRLSSCRAGSVQNGSFMASSCFSVSFEGSRY